MADLMYGGSSSGGAALADKPELGLDTAAETSFITWFHRMPAKDESTVRLFDRGDFFSAHGQDAQVVAATTYKTQSVLKTLGRGKDALASVTLNINAAKSFLREALTSKQLKVEIWGGGTSKKHSWQLEKQATPGNLQQLEDLLFTGADLDTSPIVVALRTRSLDGTKMVGAAFADASNRTLGVAEFAENDIFSNTESLLIQLGAKECLMPSDDNNVDYDIAKLKTVVTRCGCIVTPVRRGDFNLKSIEQDVNRLLNEDDAGENLTQFGLKISMGSMQALLSYLSLLSDETNFGQFSIRTHDLSQYLRLDNSALRALSVFPEPGQTGTNKSASVFGLLNQCKTPQGQRLLGQWLKQPLVNAHEIRKRHTLVEVFTEDTALRQTIQTDFLRYMPDLLRNSKRFQKGAANLEDVVNVYQAIIRLQLVIDSLKQAGIASTEATRLVQSAFILPMEESQILLSKLVEMVETTIDLDELQRHRYVIKPQYDDRLGAIRDAIDQVINDLQRHHAAVRKDLKMDEKVKLEDTQQYGYCFRVTRNDAKVLTGKKDRYIELGTSKAGVYFTTRDVKELSNDHIDLQNKYNSHQSGLVKQVVNIAAGYCSPLEQLNSILATLDVIISFAHVSVNAPLPYVRPAITELGKEGSVEIHEVRHPCLEVQEDLKFIPNDAEIKTGESEFLIITGPNMGGKSTYIRSIGIVALMSQAGCFVPTAPGAKLPVFDAILARVGAGDSQLKGVSTFMSEMLETSTILRLATKDSLIIIDELGRGTSTYDGFGLAWSISEHIARRLRSKCLFASHFAEIVALADQVPHVKNLHCKALVTAASKGASKQDSDITLLYRVEPGICDRSYGIHVAELAGFPPSVIKLAKRKAEEMEDLDEDDVPPLLASDAESTTEGMAIMKQFLQEFAEQRPEPKYTHDIDEDVDVDVTSSPHKKRRQEEAERDTQRATADRAALETLVAKYRDQVEGNPWLRSVLECL